MLGAQTAGHSMVPTLSGSTNLIMVESLSRTFPMLRDLRRGDIVTAINPVTHSHVCKRILALPGDALLTKVHGEHDEIPNGPDGKKWVKVPKGHVWLAGDNPARTFYYIRIYGVIRLNMAS